MEFLQNPSSVYLAVGNLAVLSELADKIRDRPSQLLYTYLLKFKTYYMFRLFPQSHHQAGDSEAPQRFQY
jgi:hypothetical protein